jgi:hypothetical protein
MPWYGIFPIRFAEYPSEVVCEFDLHAVISGID